MSCFDWPITTTKKTSETLQTLKEEVILKEKFMCDNVILLIYLYMDEKGRTLHKPHVIIKVWCYWEHHEEHTLGT
jgi:hypothetical protein